MKISILITMATLLFCGCASTVNSRKQERSAAYASLSAEMKNLVDKGEVTAGMPMDAVYIAWGKPAQVLTGQPTNGVSTVTWIYHGTALEDRPYWNVRPYSGGYTRGGAFSGPSLEHEYYQHDYAAAEVTFENGQVKSWRTLPKPAF